MNRQAIMEKVLYIIHPLIGMLILFVGPPRQALETDQAIAKQRGVKTTFKASRGWWRHFKARHPDLVRRRREKLDFLRASGTNASICNKYFDVGELPQGCNGITRTHHSGSLRQFPSRPTSFSSRM
jgi:hypothetical protein